VNGAMSENVVGIIVLGIVVGLIIGGAFYFAGFFTIPECNNEEIAAHMDSFLDTHISESIKKYGPPKDVKPDGNGGSVYIYGATILFQKIEIFVYADAEGIIYYWSSPNNCGGRINSEGMKKVRP